MYYVHICVTPEKNKVQPLFIPYLEVYPEKNVPNTCAKPILAYNMDTAFLVFRLDFNSQTRQKT